MPDPPNELQILVVDDNPVDVRLMKEAFHECTHPHRLHVASDGIQALAFITRLEPFADAPWPGLIIVDLNMPGIDGYGVLVAVKHMEDSHDIPVIMFSSSDNQFDVKKAYNLYADCYVVKPRDFRAFAHTICSLVTFWTEKATLPPD